MWDAEHASQNVGLSHNVLARTTRQGDDTVVEAITKVQSIDLVADPATTRGLFEQNAPAISWDSLTIEQLELHRPDLLRELRQAHAAQLEQVQSQLDQIAARDAALERRGRIAELLQEHNLPLPDSRDESSRRIVSDHFVETLLGAADDAALRRLVEERAAIVRSAKRWNNDRGASNPRPVSRDQLAVSHGTNGVVRDAQEFAAAICGR
jgi:hypothetical protein